MSRYQIVLQFVKEYKWRYVIGILFLLSVDILQLVFPKVIGYVTDDLKSGKGNLKNLAIYCIIILAIAIFTALFRLSFRYFIFGSEKRFEYNIRGKLFDHLLKLSPNFYNHNKTGDLMAHATNDVNAIRMAVGPGITMTTDALFLSISTIFIMAKTIDWRLTVLALLPLPIITLLALKFGNVIHERFSNVQESFSRLTDTVQESLSGIRVVKAFVQERAEHDKFQEACQNTFDQNMKLVRLMGIAFPIVQTIASVSFIIVLIYGGFLVMYGDITLGDFFAFNVYLGLLIGPMMSFGWVVNMFQRGLASLDRINIILNQKPEIIDESPLDVKDIKGDIEIRNLSFSYGKDLAPALENIKLHIPQGRTLAIMGRTGSGKTTLVNLLLRMYNAPQNTLFIDGIPIEKIPLRTLREEIAYVPQDNFLFSASIKENVAFSTEEINMEKVERMTRISKVYDNIIEFPKQFDTLVGERGVTLSGGQKQRVSIARALFKDPHILILDDSFSAVDTHTEEEILRDLKNFMKNRTNIIISHRISTIQEADEIIVLDEGKIIERGNHESLLSLNGFYADLYHKQLLEKEIEQAN